MTLTLSIARAAPRAPLAGDQMENGLVYCGVSPQTNRALYTLKTQFDGRLSWKDAQRYTSRIRLLNYWDWRVPTMDEMRVLHEVKERIGEVSNELYWSSAPHYYNCKWAMNLRTGEKHMIHAMEVLRFKIVRGPDPYRQE